MIPIPTKMYRMVKTFPAAVPDRRERHDPEVEPLNCGSFQELPTARMKRISIVTNVTIAASLAPPASEPEGEGDHGEPNDHGEDADEPR
jgi:hypothetical protein